MAPPGFSLTSPRRALSEPDQPRRRFFWGLFGPHINVCPLKHFLENTHLWGQQNTAFLLESGDLKGSDPWLQGSIKDKEPFRLSPPNFCPFPPQGLLEIIINFGKVHFLSMK